MDPTIVALAGKAMAILIPYVARTAEEFVNAAGQAGYDKAKSLMERLRAKWSGEPGSSVILDNFEKQPEPFEPAMEAVLQQTLAADEQLREEVERTVQEVGPLLVIVQRGKVATDATGLRAKEFVRGNATVTQEFETGTNITGAHLDRIG